MKIPRIGLTGATSALGEIVLDSLLEIPKASIVAFGRRRIRNSKIAFIQWSLGEDPGGADFDFFFHLAFDRRNLSLSSAGTIRIVRQIAQQSPSCQQVLFSSISSFRDTKSQYGAAKHLVESQLSLTLANLIIVRPGILMEPHGMGRGFLRAVAFSPVLPKDIQLLNIRTVSRKQISDMVNKIVVRDYREGEINLCGPDAFCEAEISRFRRFPWIGIPMKIFVRSVEVALRLMPSKLILRDQLCAMLANRHSPYCNPGEEK